MRTFDTGATRDADDYKLDFEAFINPRVLEIYGEYMHGKRVQVDGNLRDGDNWQKGFGQDVLAKSLVRHLMEFWRTHRGYEVIDRKSGEEVDMMDTLSAILFNTMAYMKELDEERQTMTAEERDCIFGNICR